MASSPLHGAAPRVSAPHHPVPPLACDTHSHVFAPAEQFAMPYPPRYALPAATAAAHEHARRAMGVTRGVVVQPAVYGEDPSAMLDAIALSAGALRGIAVGSRDVSCETLALWREAGVMGLRFAEGTPGRPRSPGSVGIDDLPLLAPVMRELGMHAQLWAPADLLAERLPALFQLGLPIVLDHMATPDPAEGPQALAFQTIVALLRDNDLWVKLSACRVGSLQADFSEARPFHQALIEAAPGRCLWGSDWPYIAMPTRPDAGQLLDLFMDWIDDPALAAAILSANPARLYGFASSPQ